MTQCIVPNFAQNGLVADKRPLQTLARDHTMGAGNWACLGSYADFTASGSISISERFTITRRP